MFNHARKVQERMVKNSHLRISADQLFTNSKTEPLSPAPKLALSVAEFCGAIGISLQMFYKLPPEARPKVARIGTRVLITMAAANRWLSDREALSSFDVAAA